MATVIICRRHQKHSHFTVNTKQLMFCSTIITIYFWKKYIKLINVLRGVYGVFLDININGACNAGFKYWSVLFKFMTRMIWILIVGANDTTEGDNEDCMFQWKLYSIPLRNSSDMETSGTICKLSFRMTTGYCRNRRRGERGAIWSLSCFHVNLSCT